MAPSALGERRVRLLRAGGPHRPPRDSSAAVGHGARWIEPACHHDHTSSQVKDRYGASSRSITDSAVRIAVDAEAAASGPKSP